MHKVNKANARKMLKDKDVDGYEVVSRNAESVPKMIVGLRDADDVDYTLAIDEDNLPLELEPVAIPVPTFTTEELAQQDLEGSNPRGHRVKKAREGKGNNKPNNNKKGNKS